MAAEFEDASTYDRDLARGIRLSGYPKEHFARGRVAFLGRHWTPPRPGPRILDFGCGLGETTELLARAFEASRAVGVDPSPSAIAEARRRHAGAGLSFAGIERLEEAAPFDLVYLNGVMHHVAPAERPALVARLRSLLAGDGALAIFENNAIHPGTRWVMARIPFDRDARPLAGPALRRLLRRGGFTRVGPARYCFFFPRPLRALDRFESALSALPAGTQYLVLARP